jgi:hypothetical protein
MINELLKSNPRLQSDYSGPFYSSRASSSDYKDQKQEHYHTSALIVFPNSISIPINPRLEDLEIARMCIRLLSNWAT